MSTNQKQSPVKILRIKELARYLSISVATIYDWLNPKSSRYDPTFPKQIKLGKAAAGFIIDEIDNWLANQARENQ